MEKIMTPFETANALADALATTEATLAPLIEAARSHANALASAPLGENMQVGPMRKQLIIAGAQEVKAVTLGYHDMLSRYYDPRVATQDSGGGK
jgi:hypothetical protein